MTPAWILGLLATLMLAVAAVSAVRLVVARPWRRGSVIIDTDIAHLLMAIAMAGMLTASLRTLPGIVWEVIFGLLIAWYGLRVAGDARASGIRALAGGHCAPHLVHSAAMLSMFLDRPGAGSMTGTAVTAGMPGASSVMLPVSDPTLALVFALVLIGYSIWDTDQLSGRRYSRASERVAPALARVSVPALAGAALASGGAGAGAVSCPPAPVGGGTVAGDTAGRFLLSPAVTIGCRVTMGVVMAFMLLIAR